MPYLVLPQECLVATHSVVMPDVNSPTKLTKSKNFKDERNLRLLASFLHTPTNQNV